MADEVSDWLAERSLPFERAAQYLGRSGQMQTVDYVVRVPEFTAFIFLLSTSSRPQLIALSRTFQRGCAT